MKNTQTYWGGWGGRVLQILIIIQDEPAFPKILIEIVKKKSKHTAWHNWV